MVTWVEEEFENRALGSLDGPHVMTMTPEEDGSSVPDARTFPATFPAYGWLTDAGSRTNRTLGRSVVVATPREAGPTVGGGARAPPGARGA